MEPLSHVQGGCRVIAFDRPPYGLSQRPLSWEGGEEGSPYTNQASLTRSQCIPGCTCSLLGQASAARDRRLLGLLPILLLQLAAGRESWGCM